MARWSSKFRAHFCNKERWQGEAAYLWLGFSFHYSFMVKCALTTAQSYGKLSYSNMYLFAIIHGKVIPINECLWHMYVWLGKTLIHLEASWLHNSIKPYFLCFAVLYFWGGEKRIAEQFVENLHTSQLNSSHELAKSWTQMPLWMKTIISRFVLYWNGWIQF